MSNPLAEFPKLVKFLHFSWSLWSLSFKKGKPPLLCCSFWNFYIWVYRGALKYRWHNLLKIFVGNPCDRFPWIFYIWIGSWCLVSFQMGFSEDECIQRCIGSIYPQAKCHMYDEQVLSEFWSFSGCVCRVDTVCQALCAQCASCIMFLKSNPMRGSELPFCQLSPQHLCSTHTNTPPGSPLLLLPTTYTHKRRGQCSGGRSVLSTIPALPLPGCETGVWACFAFLRPVSCLKQRYNRTVSLFRTSFWVQLLAKMYF